MGNCEEGFVSKCYMSVVTGVICDVKNDMFIAKSFWNTASVRWCKRVYTLFTL